ANMVSVAELGPSDAVLEIGPGLGVLTEELAATGAAVVAVELDDRLAHALSERLAGVVNVHIREGDALTTDLGELVREPYTVVASLPYQAGTRILFRLLTQSPRPRRMVVMLQEEVTRRILMQAGGSYLGMAVSALAEAHLVRRVPPGAFYPVPKVRS